MDRTVGIIPSQGRFPKKQLAHAKALALHAKAMEDSRSRYDRCGASQAADIVPKTQCVFARRIDRSKPN